MVDIDATEALLAWFDGYPLLAGVIIDHHRGTGLANTLLTTIKERKGHDRYMLRHHKSLSSFRCISLKLHYTLSSHCNPVLNSPEAKGRGDPGSGQEETKVS